MNRLNIWIILLLVSVLLNGVLIGAGARNWFSPPPSAPSGETLRMGGGGFQLRAFVATLPPEERRSARVRVEETRQDLRGLVREVAMARRAAARALLAEPFDPQSAAAALDRSRQARAALEQATEILILDIAADLEPEERQAAFHAAMRLPRFDGPRPVRPSRPPLDRAPGD